MRPAWSAYPRPSGGFHYPHDVPCLYNSPMLSSLVMKQVHDYGYKELFSHPQILKELLISCVHEPWVQYLDFSRACTIDKSFITPAKKKLESDLIWRIPLTTGVEIYLYILIEFQSTVDHFMALRILRYILEFYANILKGCTTI
jgi:predicted transposase/invertase (TIGR01784 family)